MSNENVYNTEKINDIIKEYSKTGYLPRNNPFYLRDIRKRKGFLHYQYTDEEITELAKIQKSCLYFANNFAYCMTDDGISKIKLRAYQSRVLQQFDNYRFNIFLSSRQSGKCLSGKSIITVNDNDITIQDFFENVYYYKMNRNLLFLLKIKRYLQRKLNNQKLLV